MRPIVSAWIGSFLVSEHAHNWDILELGDLDRTQNGLDHVKTMVFTT